LNASAYNSETFRADINSIRKGQTEAALALGMSHTEAMLKIVLPQAARRVLQVLASTASPTGESLCACWTIGALSSQAITCTILTGGNNLLRSRCCWTHCGFDPSRNS
jgi:ABC-type amino acid transport system permease subunit